MASDPTPRAFIYAPEMAKLGERIGTAEAAIEKAREVLDDLENAGDLVQRVAYLVLAIRDFRASTINHDELYERARRALDGIRGDVPDEILDELGPAFNRPTT